MNFPIILGGLIIGSNFEGVFAAGNFSTTVLWGEADTAFALAVLDGLDAYVERLDVQRVAGASHWIVHEQPALVAGAMARLLRPRRSVP